MEQTANTKRRKSQENGGRRASQGQKAGKGKGGELSKPKAQKKIKRDNIKGFSDNAIERLGRKAGVERISAEVYDKIRQQTLEYLEKVLKDAVLVAEHSRRKTLQSKDVTYALERAGVKYYGAK